MLRTLLQIFFFSVFTATTAYSQGWEGDLDENGQLHGHAMKFNSNGLPVEEADFRHGVLHGEYIKSDDRMDGIVVSATYRDGLLHGSYISHFEDKIEQKETEGEYDNGNKVGEWRHFYRSGRRHLVINYVNGTLHGPYPTFPR